MKVCDTELEKKRKFIGGKSEVPTGRCGKIIRSYIHYFKVVEPENTKNARGHTTHLNKQQGHRRTNRTTSSNRNSYELKQNREVSLFSHKRNFSSRYNNGNLKLSIVINDNYFYTPIKQ